jgi:uncharacterized protein
MMTRLTACAIALLIGVLASARAEAEAPRGCGGRDLTSAEGLAAAEPQPADDLVNAEGLLWRIEKPGVPPSYLFGTMHSTDDSAVEVARRAAGEIEGAKVVATELGGPMDPVEKANIGAATLARALDRDHDTFEGPVAPEDRDRIEKFLAGRGYPNEFSHHLKLWFLALLTAFPACEVERAALNLPEVDELLTESARDDGVKVIGLETPKEQLDVIASMRPEVAATLLNLAARQPDMNDDVYATMLRLYRESRPAEILPIADSLAGLSEAERAAQEEFMRVLLLDRNAAMVERTAPLLASGGAFIAVGALHLVGKNGLVERFRAEGYTATKVW